MDYKRKQSLGFGLKALLFGKLRSKGEYQDKVKSFFSIYFRQHSSCAGPAGFLKTSNRPVSTITVLDIRSST